MFNKILEGLRKKKQRESEMVSLNAALHAQFNDFMFSHLDWAMEAVPDGAMIMNQIEGNERFNNWSKRLVTLSIQPEQPVFIARFRQTSNGEAFELSMPVLHEGSMSAGHSC